MAHKKAALRARYHEKEFKCQHHRSESEEKLVLFIQFLEKKCFYVHLLFDVMFPPRNKRLRYPGMMILEEIYIK